MAQRFEPGELEDRTFSRRQTGSASRRPTRGGPDGALPPGAPVGVHRDCGGGWWRRARRAVGFRRRGGEDDGGGGAVETGESWKLERQYAELGGVFPKNSGSLLGLIWACT